MQYNDQLYGFWDFITEGAKAAGRHFNTKLERDIAEINLENTNALRDIYNGGSSDTPRINPYLIGGIALGAVALTVIMVKK